MTLREIRDELVAARDGILAQIQPLEDEAIVLRRAVDHALALWSAKRQEVAALEQALGLREISLRIAALSRRLPGTKSIGIRGG